MIKVHISLFCISFWFIPLMMISQTAGATLDTVPKSTKYGLRLGVDIVKPIRSILDDRYQGFEILGDYRVYKKFYAAAEIGNEKKEIFESSLRARASGSYIKIGANFNAYNNWFGLNNEIFTGLRYGFSTFKQELLSYDIYTSNQTFPPTSIEEPKEFKGLTGHWAELIVGIKTEVINNVYLSINLQLKRKLSDDKPENFNNLYIPGYNKTYDFSQYGAGYGYTISYLIPLYKK